MSQKKVDVRLLNKKETYSLMLSAIYAAEADPEYRLLSDLMCLLDEETFKLFLSLFEGQTIKVPSIDQLSEMLKALMIYTCRDLRGMDWDDIAKLINASFSTTQPFRGTVEYKRLKELIKQKKLNIGGLFDEFPSKSCTFSNGSQ